MGRMARCSHDLICAYLPYEVSVDLRNMQIGNLTVGYQKSETCDYILTERLTRRTVSGIIWNGQMKIDSVNYI